VCADWKGHWGMTISEKNGCVPLWRAWTWRDGDDGRNLHRTRAPRPAFFSFPIPSIMVRRPPWRSLWMKWECCSLTPFFSFWRREGHIGTQEWIEEKKTANAKFLRQNTKISLRVDGLIGPKSALACHELSRVSIMRRVPCRTHCHNRCQVGRRRRRTGGV